MGKKRKKDYWETALDDPLFYVPFIGPLLHGIRCIDEEDDNDEEWEEEEWEEDNEDFEEE